MDCSKTIGFFVEMQRLCASRLDCSVKDDRCPLYEFCEKAIPNLSRKDTEYAIETLHKWSRENPRKTYAQDFFEKFPKAQSGSDGTPFVCKKTIYGEVPPKDERCDRRGACKNCWNEPMEE